MASIFDVTAWSLTAQIALLAVLVLLSGFFSGSETALIGLASYRRRHLADGGSHEATVIDLLMKRPERLLIGILIGNNLVNTAAAAIATSIAIGAFGSVGIGIATGVMTLILLTFGEILPKALATGKPARFSMRVARPLHIFIRVSTPLIWMFGKVTDLMYRVTKVPKERRMLTDTDEFRTIVRIGAQEGVLEREEEDMIHRVIEFSETTAREAMVARTDMTGLPDTTVVSDAVKTFVDSGYSRAPIFKESRDNVIGILYAKDVLAAIAAGATDEPITTYLQEPYYVPESTKLHDLFREMRDRRVHMAIVLDEFGGTSGLITMEDILEEIVGEIFDEYDTDAGPIMWLEDDEAALIDARIHLDDLNRALDVEIPEEEGYDTLGGFVFHELGRPPVVGDTVRQDNAEFVVERASRKRVFSVKYRPIVPADEAEPGIE